MTNHNTLLTPALNHEIMSKIREGYYQHPGEEEAIDISFNPIKKDPSRLLLDIGCGCGGTAIYIQKQGWGKVTGIDINPKMIATATKNCKDKFPHTYSPKFYTCDVMNINNVFSKQRILFDVIYSFSAVFLFPDHIAALQELAHLADKNTQLLIFDYTDYGHYAEHAYIDNGKYLMPNIIKHNDIVNTFALAGWHVIATEQMDDLYIKWYSELLSKINIKKNYCIEHYGEHIFECFSRRYQHILDALRSRLVGGIIIRAVVEN